MDFEQILRLFPDARPSGNGWMAKCPAHEDRRPSLSITKGRNGATLLRCMAGCETSAICGSVNIRLSDLFNQKSSPRNGGFKIIATYDYRDEEGNLLMQVCRLEPKGFRQRRPDTTAKGGWVWKTDGVRRVPFRLPELLAAVAAGWTIYICEGERDVLVVVESGFAATCNPGGAGKWPRHFSGFFKEAEVIVIADKDAPGRAHAQQVAASLHGTAASVRVIELPDIDGKPVKDAADYFAAGGQAAELDEIARSAPIWTPQQTTTRSAKECLLGENLPEEAGTVANAAADVAPRDDLTECEFTDLLATRIPTIKTAGSDWYACEKGTWEKTQRDKYRPAALAVMPRKIRTARRAAALLEHLESRCQVSPDNFRGFNRFDDSGGVLINAANGIVRVSTDRESELLPHDAGHMFTERAAASFDPGARADLFSSKLNEMLPDELDRDLLQLCFGNFLLPDCRFEVALVSYGKGGYGKSTLSGPVAAALGGNLVARLTLQQLCDARSYHLPKLKFAALNLGTELNALEIEDSANFKTLVSGEPVEARPIYGQPFTMQSTCKLWFIANGLPRFKNGSDAELRRTRFVRFDIPPAVKDVTLKNRVLAERDGVFLFMLTGLQRLLTLPEIPLGGAESRAVHTRFMVSNDPVGTFVSHHCELASDARESKEALKSAFAEFCEMHNISGDVGDYFFRRLYERFPSLKDVRTSADGERVRRIAGIRLKPNLEIL